MFAYSPTINDDFEDLAQQVFRQRTSLLEDEILSFWREYEPKKTADLLLHGILRKTLRQQARAMLELQEALEETEGVSPALSKMEAWRRLMSIEEDEAEEAEAWGMTLEEYRSQWWRVD